MGLSDAKTDKRLLTKRDRVRNVALINELFGNLFAEKSKEYWLELLERHKIPCGPINNVKEVVESPQVKARGMIVELEHAEAGRIKMAGSPIKASLTPPSVQFAPPLLGQDTESVLSQLGYGPEEIGAFRAEGDV